MKYEPTTVYFAGIPMPAYQDEEGYGYMTVDFVVTRIDTTPESLDEFLASDSMERQLCYGATIREIEIDGVKTATVPPHLAILYWYYCSFEHNNPKATTLRDAGMAAEANKNA